MHRVRFALHTVTITLLLCSLARAELARTSVDARLINNCAARTDARMESMTQGKLEQIRNYEFSLRMAMAQLAGGPEVMSPGEWQRATTQLSKARNALAQVCEVSVPLQG